MDILFQNKPFSDRVQFMMGHSLAIATPVSFFATLAENPTVQVSFVALFFLGALGFFLAFSLVSAYEEQLGGRRVAQTVLLIASSFTLRTRKERIVFNAIMIGGLFGLTLIIQHGYRLIIPLAVGAVLVFVVGEVFAFIDQERLERETALRILLDSSPLPSLIVRGGVCEYSNLAARERFEILSGEHLRDFLLGIPPWWGASALGSDTLELRYTDGSMVSTVSHYCPLGLDPTRMYVVIVPPDDTRTTPTG